MDKELDDLYEPSIELITEFLRKCISDDVLYETKELLDFNSEKRKKQKDSLKHLFDRQCKNDNIIDYEVFSKDNDESLVSYLINICSGKTKNDLINKYAKQNCFLGLFLSIYDFYINFSNSCIVDFPAHEAIFKILINGIYFFIIQATKSDNRFLDIFWNIFSENRSVELLLREFQKRIGKDFEELCLGINNYIKNDNTEHMRTCLCNWKNKEGYNIKWVDLKVLLEYASEYPNFQMAFIEQYFIENYRKALREVLKLSDRDCEKLRENTRQFLLNLKNKNNDSILHELEESLFYNKKVKEDIDEYITISNNVEKNKQISFDEKILKLQEKKLQLLQKGNVNNAFKFFESWRIARLYVFNDEIEKAKEKYEESFLYKKFAGSYIEPFLDDAIALFSYKNINYSKTQIAGVTVFIPCKAKKYWTYGNLINVIKKSAKESFPDGILSKEYFFKQFPEENFVNPINFEEDFIDIEKIYKKLEDLTDKSINRRIPLEKEGCKYTKLSISLLLGIEDDRFYKKIESIIKRCDLKQKNDDGSNALNIALVAYKVLKWKIISNSEKEKKYKNYILFMIDKMKKDDILFWEIYNSHPLTEAVYVEDNEITTKLLNIDGIEIENKKFNFKIFLRDRINLFKYIKEYNNGEAKSFFNPYRIINKELPELRDEIYSDSTYLFPFNFGGITNFSKQQTALNLSYNFDDFLENASDDMFEHFFPKSELIEEKIKDLEKLLGLIEK